MNNQNYKIKMINFNVLMEKKKNNQKARKINLLIRYI